MLMLAHFKVFILRRGHLFNNIVARLQLPILFIYLWRRTVQYFYYYYYCCCFYLINVTQQLEIYSYYIFCKNAYVPRTSSRSDGIAFGASPSWRPPGLWGVSSTSSSGSCQSYPNKLYISPNITGQGSAYLSSSQSSRAASS